jgi:hypothetical protein
MDAFAAPLNLARSDGMIMEFGVYKGRSTRRIANLIGDRILYGFDSFNGLPDDWLLDDGTVYVRRGSFSTKQTVFPGNVTLVVGLFQDTLPSFLAAHKETVAFVHIDCDLYSSTKFVLASLRPRLIDTIVVLDDYRGNPANDHNVGRAFKEFVAETGADVEFFDRLRISARGATVKISVP